LKINYFFKIEKQFEEIEAKFQSVEGEFDLCVKLNKKIDQKFENLQVLMKGVQFSKISSKNPKKSSPRTVFYSPCVEGLCWKETKSPFPKAHQVFPIKDIIKIHTNYEKFSTDCSKKAVSKIALPARGQDQACFIAIESESKLLMLIAPNENMKNIYTKVLNSMIKSQRQVGYKFSSVKDSVDQGLPQDFDHINDKYTEDIRRVRTVSII
jgi:hypothetical protein